MGALAASFAACDEPAPSVPPVQSNPQEPILDINAVEGTAVGAFADGSTINLADAAPYIDIFTADYTDTIPAGATLQFSCEVSNTEDFATYYQVPIEFEDHTAKAQAKGIDNAVVAFYGDSQTTRDLYYRVIPYVNIDGTNFRMGKDYLVSGQIAAVPTNWDSYVSPNFYMLGDATSWSLADCKDYAFTKQGDVYVYNLVMAEGKEFLYWKIATDFAVEYNTWQGTLCFPTPDFATGSATMILADSNAGHLTTPGTYRIILNPVTREVNVRLLPGFLYTPGNSNGWDFGKSQLLYYVDRFDANVGAMMGQGEFKLSKTPNWDGTNWGMGASAGTLAVNGQNIKVPEGSDGLQWMSANTVDLTYVLTRVTSVGVVGELNKWNEKAPVELTANEDETVWSGDVELSGEWKIVLNHSFDSNYGGLPEDLTIDGDNFKGYDGTYTVAVDFSGTAPAMKLTKK